MKEAFVNESWNILVITLKEIYEKEEIVVDFNLHTKSTEEAKINCTCRKKIIDRCYLDSFHGSYIIFTLNEVYFKFN